MQKKPSKFDLCKAANRLLSKNGFTPTGGNKEGSDIRQTFFEKRVLRTPMGNGMR